MGYRERGGEAGGQSNPREARKGQEVRNKDQRESDRTRVLSFFIPCKEIYEKKNKNSTNYGKP